MIHPQGIEVGMEQVLFFLLRIDRRYDLIFAAVRYCNY